MNYGEQMKKLGQMLVEQGRITGEQLIRAIQSQRMVGGRLGTCLLEMDVLSEDELLDTLSKQLEVPAARIDQLRRIDDDTLELIPARLANRCQAVPFASTRHELKVATLNVHNLAFIGELEFASNKRVRPYIANEVRIFEALEKYYGLEIPRRYGYLLDRLNRSRYLWDESAKILLGAGEVQMEWTEPHEVFEDDDVIRAPSAKSHRHAAAVAAAPAQPVSRTAAQTGVEPPPPGPAPGLAAPPPAVEPSAPAGDLPPAGTPPSDLAAAPTFASGSFGSPALPFPPPPERSPTPALTAFDEEPAQTTPAASPTSPAVWTLEDADRELTKAAGMDDIAGVLLRYAGQSFSRTALFRVRQGEIRGFRLQGEGCDEELFRQVVLAPGSPSIFLDLDRGPSSLYRGPLAPMPAHRRIASTWGGELPRECLAVPIRVGDRPVLVLYGDRGSQGLGGLDPATLLEIASKASMALELVILRNKMRGA